MEKFIRILFNFFWTVFVVLTIFYHANGACRPNKLLKLIEVEEFPGEKCYNEVKHCRSDDKMVCVREYGEVYSVNGCLLVFLACNGIIMNDFEFLHHGNCEPSECENGSNIC